METFKNVKKGYEVEFLNDKKMLERALVSYVDDKKFSVKVLRYSNHKKEWYELELNWFLSGKRTSRYHNYGEALRIVNNLR